MSKIYDALRKAERERQEHRRPASGKPSPRRVEEKSDQSPRSDYRDAFLSGLDANFRRSLMTLRNAVESEARDREMRTIMFTSAIRGEGKTTMVYSFSRVLAIGGSHRICLVDCSIRRPSLHRIMQVGNEKGIIDHLGGKAELEEIVQKMNGIDFIPAGVVSNTDISVPLFNSKRMAQLMSRLSEEYDHVLIDTAAILEAPETPIIGSYCDGVILVVHTGNTRREVIKRAMQMVEKLDGRFIGTVLNRKKYYIPEFIYRRV